MWAPPRAPPPPSTRPTLGRAAWAAASVAATATATAAGAAMRVATRPRRLMGPRLQGLPGRRYATLGQGRKCPAAGPGERAVRAFEAR
ncbi:hypothetical protein D3C83_50790 [compost metagenome]